MERLKDIPGWIFFSISFDIYIATTAKERSNNLKVISFKEIFSDSAVMTSERALLMYGYNYYSLSALCAILMSKARSLATIY